MFNKFAFSVADLIWNKIIGEVFLWDAVLMNLNFGLLFGLCAYLGGWLQSSSYTTSFF